MVIFEKEYLTAVNLKEVIISAIEKEICRMNTPVSISEYELQLLLDEALENAMEHGNKWDPCKKIRVKMISGSDSIQIEIGDEGRGFNFPGTLNEQYSSSALRQRGRGLQLIRGLCHSEWSPGDNALKLNIPLEFAV